MHNSRGLPLISTLNDPHLPALQFHRIARSLASRDWIRCSTSSTTIPGSTSGWNVLNSPPVASPRQTLNVRLDILALAPCLREVRADLARLEVLDLRVRDRDQGGGTVRSEERRVGKECRSGWAREQNKKECTRG